MIKSETQLFKFGEFQINTVKRVLLHDNTPVQLPSRAFDVLLALVEHNQYVIDKDELMRLVWGERVVEENNLTRHISTLRKALDESPNDHRYIVTVPGRGYSFVAEVERVATKGAQSSAAKKNGDTSVMDAEHRNGAHRSSAEFIAPLSSLDRSGEAIRSQPFGLVQKAFSRKFWLWTSAMMVVLVVVGLLGFNLLDRRLKHITVNSFRDWDTVRLTRNGGSILPDISSDGKYVAYVNKESGQESVWIHHLATSTTQQVVPPEKYKYFDLLFSPDGNEVYFTRREGAAPQRALYRMPVIGGVPRRLRDDIDSSITLSSDGTRLAFARRNREGRSEFIIADANGVEGRILTDQRIQFPAWSPDGKVIAYSVGDAGAGGDNMTVHEVRLDDGSQKEISQRRWNYVGNKSWLPDGGGLIISAREQKSNVNQLWLVAYPSGAARLLSDNLDYFHRTSLTKDSSTLAAEHVNPVSDIWSGQLADMANARKVGVWGMSGLCLLSDGRILYSSVQAGDAGKIWIMNGDGTQPRQLTLGTSHDVSPVASRDQRYIVFASNRSGNFEIWRTNLDGGDLTQMTQSKGATWPSISPDSRWIIYLSSNDHSLNRVPLEGGEPERIVGKAVGASAVSPDGKLIAYFSQEKDAWGIAVSAFEGGSLIRKFEILSHSLNNSSLKWMSDGKGLLYADSWDGVGNVWIQRLDGSAPNKVTAFNSDGLFRFDLSSDGKDLICARGGWKHDVVLIKNLSSALAR